MQPNDITRADDRLDAPVELDPALWSEVGGGTPKNTWSQPRAAELAATDTSGQS